MIKSKKKVILLTIVQKKNLTKKNNTKLRNSYLNFNLFYET